MKKFSPYLRFIGILAWLAISVFKQVTLAQNSNNLKINEFLAINDSNFQDDYGRHSPWIEIFNAAYSYANIGGMYITNDLSNPRKYLIPKGDPITVIAPRSFLILWADGKPTHGTLHLNFTLKEKPFIALFDADGKTLLDSVSFPPQKSDITYGRLVDGENKWGFLEKTTPGSTNDTTEKTTSAEQFGKLDPLGVGMTMIAMSVVFTALILLYLTFKNVARLYTLDFKRKKLVKEGKHEEAESMKEEISGEVAAAIAMAIYHYKNQYHDHENTILTIRKVAKTYSPWSSKIYGLRKIPRN